MSSHNPEPVPAPWLAAQLAVIGRQLLLVPEAVLLLAVICLHSAMGSPPALALLGLVIILCFVVRMSLLFAARRAVEKANYSRAEQLALIALWLYPYSADAHAIKGTVQLATGCPADAARALRRAVDCYPFQSSLYTALSAALLEDGQPEEAQLAARQALALDPANASAYLHLAGATELLGANTNDIERQLRLGLDQPAPPADEAALRCALAALLVRAGRPGEAQLVLSGAERLLERCPAPQRAGLHFYLGELLRLSGDNDAARTHFSASESLDPHGRYAAAAWRAARS